MSTTTTNYGFIKPELSDTADITAYNPNWEKLDTELSHLNTLAIVVNSNDGITYYGTTADTNNVPSDLTGLEFTIVPSVTNVSTAPTLNINKIGALPIRLALSTNTASTITLPVGFLVANRPVKVMLDDLNGYWKIVDKQKTSGSDIYGVVPITSGGTNAATAEEARANLGITPANIGALPAVLVEGEHYDTELPEPGIKGRIFFKILT